MDTKEPFVILSAERADLSSAENDKRTYELNAKLTNLNYAFDSVEGCYKGKKENSFIVLASDGTREFDKLVALAIKYGQESILVVGSNREASLYYVSKDNSVSDIQGLGKFVHLAESEALKRDAWTKRGNYYYGVI